MPETDSALMAFRGQPNVALDGSEVALEGCVLTTPGLNQSSQVVSFPRFYHRTYFFKHYDGTLRLFSATQEEEVENVDDCPS